MGSIRVLPPETARLIAAGEVIDRPASALRELLDNAIDSEAKEISVCIEEGGIGLIRVVDDGKGMDADDLSLACLPHATSKIRSADDLLRTKSLGFRGEALASIAAAAHLEIVSKDLESPAAHRLVSEAGRDSRMEACAGRRGTTVSVSGLFKDFPARRQFLKRPQAEAALCRQVFEDKALAHPALSFRYESGSGATLRLTAGSRLERVAALAGTTVPKELLHQIAFSGPGFEGEVVLAGPAFSRSDKRLMQAFVNRRRVQEFGLIASLDYAFASYLPGGLHPLAFLFLEIDPALADFNIHPAKKEVRFKDPETPRRAMIRAVQDFLSLLARRDPQQARPDASKELGLELEAVPPSAPMQWEEKSWPAASSRHRESGSLVAEPNRDWSGFDAVAERRRAQPDKTTPREEASQSFRYIGQALGPFLLFEMKDELWFLDQHAAHERMLFDELSAKPLTSQELLVPEILEPENDAESEFIGSQEARLKEAGFSLKKEGSDGLVTAAPPELSRGAAEAALSLARESGDARRAALAMAACKAAIKDGDLLDRATATDLIGRALRLPEARCPHGRPIWTKVSREQLYRLVRRLV